MKATDLYAEALSTLTGTRTTMLSAQWQASLDDGSKQERMDASKQLIRVQVAISSLSNAILTKIADRMCAQEQDLKRTATALQDAMKTLENIQSVVGAITGFLDVVAKIVPLI